MPEQPAGTRTPAPTTGALAAWQPLRLDTPVDLLAETDIMAIHREQFVVATISPVVHGVLGLDLASVSTWRNGGDWPRDRTREVPGFTTVESLSLAHGVAPTRAFVLPGLTRAWLGPPRVADDGRIISLEEALARLPKDEGPRAAAVARVDEIRALYGRMLSDISYRIENSALFDSTVSTTRAFDTALALFADVTPNTSDDEVTRRSAVVVLSFRTARSHAETIGLKHLPTTAHDSARRAAGAARLARSSTSEAERDAARLRVISILRSLALEYLPDPATLPHEITTGKPAHR